MECRCRGRVAHQCASPAQLLLPLRQPCRGCCAIMPRETSVSRSGARQALRKVGIWLQPRRVGFQALSAGCIVNAKKFVDRCVKNFTLFCVILTLGGLLRV